MAGRVLQFPGSDYVTEYLGIEVSEHDVLARSSEFATEIPGCCCLANATLSVRDADTEVSALNLTSQAGPARGATCKVVGAVRVPLTAIRGLGTEAVQHILSMRAAFGQFTSLLDFCQRIERTIVDRRGVLVLVKLGAFSFTGLPRAQLALAERVYSATADLLRAGDRHPAAIAPLEDELTQLVSRSAEVVEWPPEVLAADELAHLGFYVGGSELRGHALRIAEEFSTIAIAELAGHPHKAPVSIAGLITTLRVRQTKKGEEMAWLSISDPSGSVECAIFPNAYERLGQPALLREGAFLVARGRLAHEEATGTKVWIEQIVPVSGSGAHLRALATAVEHHDLARAQLDDSAGELAFGQRVEGIECT